MSELKTFLNHILDTPREKVVFYFLEGWEPGEIQETLNDRLEVDKWRNIQENSVVSQPPFWPFLDLVKEKISSNDLPYLQSFLENSNLYQPHKEVWESVLGEKDLHRLEDILPGEMLYEQKRFREDLKILVDTLVIKTPGVYLVTLPGDLSTSTKMFLEEYMESPPDIPVLFLFHTLQSFQNLPPRVLESGNFISQDSREGITVPVIERTTSLKNALTGFYLCALEDSRVDLEALWEQGIEDSFVLGASLGQLEFYQREVDKSMTYFQSCMAWAQKSGKLEHLAWAYRWMARVYVKEDQLDLAAQVLEKSWKIYCSLDDREGQLHNLIVKFMLEDRRRFQGIPEFKKFYMEILMKAESLGAWNYFSYVATNPFGLFSLYDEEVRKIHRQGLMKSRSLGNLHRLAVAYQTMGLAAAVQGDMNRTLKYYRKSRNLKLRLGNKLEMAYNHNGLGFYYMMAGKYSQSIACYKDSLVLLSEVQDFHEVGMTYFNMAMTALLARRPALAYEYLTVVQEIMHSLGQRNLKYHSRVGILALTGVCAYLGGYREKARQADFTITKESLVPFPQKNEEYFFLHLLKWFLLEEKGSVEAGDHLRLTQEYLDKTNDDISYMGPYYYFLLGERARESDLKFQYQKEGLRRAQVKGYKIYEEWFETWIQTQIPPEPGLPAKDKSISVSWLLHSARLQSRMVELHKRTEDIHFLNTLQSILNEEREEILLIQRTVDLIYSAYGAQGVYYHSLDPSGPKLLYSRKRAASSGDFILPQLVMHLENKKDQNLFPPVSDFEDYLDATLVNCYIGSFFIRVDEAWKGHFLLFFENEKQDWEKLKIFSLMGLQLGLGLEKIAQHQLIKRQNEDLQRKNQLLEISSYTDPLTGLGNRLALQKTLDREISRFQRYQSNDFCLLFIDLDNFKFFNDTFGHNVGDLILVETASLMETLLRDTDQLFRYGGDEFIMILPETDLEGTMILGQRVITALEKAASFAGLIQARLGGTVYIPPNRKLSCSAGATQWGLLKQTQGTVESLIALADKALYEAKKAGKGRVRVLDMTLG